MALKVVNKQVTELEQVMKLKIERWAECYQFDETRIDDNKLVGVLQSYDLYPKLPYSHRLLPIIEKLSKNQKLQTLQWVINDLPMARDFLDCLAIMHSDPNREDWALLLKLWPEMTAKKRLKGLETIYALDKGVKYSQKLMNDLMKSADEFE